MNGPLLVQGLKRDGLGPLDFSVGEARTLCLHGASGSGKTLLLRAIADLDPNQGEVTLGQQRRSQTPAHLWRSQVMYVAPEAHWWEDTVGDHATGWDRRMLATLGFDSDVLNWRVSRLSSGEKQRLGLLRALSARPAALLLDEPTANLDPDNTERAEGLIRDYQAQQASPIVWVSHDPGQRARVADQVLEIRAGQLA